MDPQTGRVRAVVYPQVAFANSVCSWLHDKTLWVLAALRALDCSKLSHPLFASNYSHQDFATVCAHHANLAPIQFSGGDSLLLQLLLRHSW